MVAENCCLSRDSYTYVKALSLCNPLSSCILEGLTKALRARMPRTAINSIFKKVLYYAPE